MVTNYQRGVSLEYRIADYIKERFPGAIVMRASGSHGPFDLCVIQYPYIHLIQAKNMKLSDTRKLTLLNSLFELSKPDYYYVRPAVIDKKHWKCQLDNILSQVRNVYDIPTTNKNNNKS